MGLFKRNPCKILYNDKTRKFSVKGFSLSLKEITGKEFSANIAEVDLASIPPTISNQLRTQAELHYQICNTIHSLKKDSPEKQQMLIKFADHMMEIEKTLVTILNPQKKTLSQDKS